MCVNGLANLLVRSRKSLREDCKPERIVQSGHSMQGNPKTIQEVRRILLEHGEKMP
jgi:hypothetical protein